MGIGRCHSGSLDFHIRSMPMALTRCAKYVLLGLMLFILKSVGKFIFTMHPSGSGPQSDCPRGKKSNSKGEMGEGGSKGTNFQS